MNEELEKELIKMKRRIKLIEKFLGGVESMKKILSFPSPDEKKEVRNKTNNKLELMLKMQRKFQEKFGFHPPLKDISAAILHEGGELWESSGGKWWKKKKHSREHRLEEMIDILHFWLAYCVEAGFSAEEIFDAYSKKLATNYKRQRRGY